MTNKQPIHINDILHPIVKRAKSFIEDDMNVKIIEETVDVIVPGMLQFKCITALISATGELNLTIAISMDEKLIDHLTDTFSYAKLNRDENVSLRQDVADEIINTIIGNASADFSTEANQMIILTPPVIVTKTDSIAKQKGAIIWANEITTQQGQMSINYICKKELFDENLYFKVS